jgi:hypothetical protein
MADYVRKAIRLILRGLVLSRPIDLLTAGEMAVARNVRSYIGGTVQQRPGQVAINATPLTPTGNAAIHSIRRLNDDLSGAANPYLRVVGAGTGLYAGTTFTGTELTAIATGFDSNPLTLIPYRPTQSPEPFMYVGNANKLGKVKDDRTYRNMGIAPPTGPPTGPGSSPIPALSSFQSTTVETGIVTAVSWVAGPGLFAVTNTVGFPTDTITAALYDAGSTGWACIGIASPGDSRLYQVGAMVTMDSNTEVVIIDSVFTSIKSTTIAAITYDSGSTGLCTIQLASHKRKALVPNVLIRLNNGGGTDEYVRVLSVNFGSDDIPSLRCSTVNTHTAAETVTGLTSFRAFFANSHAAASTLTWRMLNVSNLLIADGATVIASATRTISLDLSNIGGRPLQDSDQMNLDVYLSDPFFTNVIQEVQFQIDIDDGTFLRNYFYVPVRPSTFNPLVTGSALAQTAKSAKIASQQIGDAETSTDETAASERLRLQRKLAKVISKGNISKAENIRKRIADLSPAPDPATTDPGSPGSGQPVLGTNSFTPIRIKIGDLQRIGSDLSKTLASVAAIRVRITFVNNTGSAIPDDTLDVVFGAWWVGGSFGPDSGEANPGYIYRYRYRASESGAISRPSPATRSAILPQRQRVQLVAAASADAQVDKIDWFRFGGTLTDWRYVGTGPNTTATFNDDFPDDSIGNQGLEFDRYQPFPVVDLPRTGTCNVSGTSVTRTAGDLFNVNWAPGSRTIVNGVPASIYRVISTSLLETVENIGALSNVSFFLPDPLIQGQPLPAMWGPFIDSDGAIRFLACGATSQEGTLFVTTGNDPDSAPAGVAGNEITSPSEPLMNGCIFDGRAWVFSNLRLFHVTIGSILDVDQSPITAIRFQEVPNSRGLFARYGLCVTPQGIVFIASDGIYITNGGFPESLTDDLYPIFPHDGQPGVATGGVNPPDFSLPNAMGLDYGDGFVKFWYTDTGGVRRTLVRDMTAGGRASLDARLTVVGGWVSLDTYAAPISCHYYEEGRGLHSELGGGTDGRLYSLTGTTDAGAVTITSQVRLGAFDGGDSRAQKLWGDAMLDYASAGNVTATIGFDNYITLLTAQTLGAKAARIPQAILDIPTISNGVGQEAVNITVDLVWTDPTAVIYEWQPAYLARPENVLRRVTDDDNLGYAGPKYIRGITIEADTLNVVKDVLIQGDTGTNGVMTTQAGTLSSIRHSGRARIDYAFATPFVAHLVRMLPNDTDPFKLYDWQWVFDQYPPLDALITSWTDDGWDGPKWLEGIRLTADTANLPVNVTIQYDGETNGPVISATHNGQVTIDYAFASPIIAHNFRIVPSGNIRIFKVEWIWEKEAPLVTDYISQVATDEQKSFCHIRDGEFGYIATADITLTIVLDGTDYTYILPHGSGLFRKFYLPFQPIKFKARQYKFHSSAGFRLYRKTCWMRMKPWGGQAYQRVNAWGEDHATTNGAII